MYQELVCAAETQNDDLTAVLGQLPVSRQVDDDLSFSLA
jgi:hypothetical protein